MKTVRLVPALVFVLASALAAALAGCSDGDTVLGDATDAAAAPYPIYTAAEVAAAQVLCQAIPSAVVSVTSVSQEKALLIGSWLSCLGPTDELDAGDSGVPTSNIAGMEFTENNEYRDLVFDANGNLTNGISPVSGQSTAPLIPSTTVDGGADGARITYSFEPFTSASENNVSGQINIEWADRSFSSTYATFEDAPRRLVDGSGITYVYMGP